jgi:hypothetical protein
MYIVNFTNKSRLTLFYGQKEKKRKKERDLYRNLGHNQQCTLMRFVQREEGTTVFPVKISSFNVISN